MDVASERARRKNRSSTNINHLSLAPLTSKLPLKDHDALPDSSHSYIEGRSAPTTPRFLGAAPATPRSRSHARTPSAPTDITKSKSSSHLNSTKKSRSGTTTPRRRKDHHHTHHHGGDSDWILRTGAVVSSEAREFKGQAWLVSRQSSTSLSAMHPGGEDPFEQELARERQMSRRGSAAFVEEDGSAASSRMPSRFQSRSQSIVEATRSATMTPLDRNGDSYFPDHQESISGPDFVNLDEKLEQLEKDSEQDDEAAIRQLVREGQAGKRSWLGNMMGLSLFAVDENDDDSDSDAESLDEELRQVAQGARTPRHVEGITMLPVETIPAPAKTEGGWNDATWLLSVATKVLF